MSDLATLAIEVAFALVFVVSLWTYVRRRDPVSRDVTLVFGSVAGLFVLAVVREITGSAPQWLTLVVTALFFALPFLTLRLSGRARGIPRPVLWGAFAAYVVTVIPLLVLPSPRPPWVGPGSFVAFVVVEALAAGYLVAEGIARSGAARVRLLVAAAATALLALAVLASVVASAVPILEGVGGVGIRVLGVFAAFAYLVAFVPPRWLRRLWQVSSAFVFTERVISGDMSSPRAVWRQLVDTTAAITGANAVFAARARDSSPTVVAGTGVAPASLSSADFAEVVRAASRGTEVDSAQWPSLANTLGTRSRRGASAVLSAVAVEGGAESAVLAWVSTHHNLFAADDRRLVEIVGRRAAVLAERAAGVAAQAELNERLAAVNEALQTASQAKSDFLASMSHELRTPLSAIIGFSSLMREEPSEGESVTVLREWVEHIHSSGEHLLSLINDVLDLSKIEAGRLDLQLERVDLPTAISELIAGMRPLAANRGVELTHAVEPVELSADRGRLRQMLYNLLSNAIKFTQSGGSVTVTASRHGDDVHVSVADTGVGIAPEDHARIFLEFQQAGTAEERQAGTGLGLPLTKRLAEAHGGRVEVESAPGHGSRFTIILPVGSAEAAAPMDRAPADPGRSRGERGDILLIEDDPSAVRLLRTYLEDGGFSVRVAPDGVAGIAEARSMRPSAIVLDVLLPHVDGWEVLRELKADAQLRDVPVIVVTVVDERQLALSLGAVDFFLKPVSRDALLARLDRYTFLSKVRERTVRVLVIDDDPLALEGVCAILEPAGFEVVTADSGSGGVERARTEPFDLVICDLLMPDVDGFEVIAQLAGDEATSGVPILVLTAHDLTEAEKNRLNGQILGIVGKHEGDLAGALRAWLSRAGVVAG